jgi:hypothetical protein
MFCTFSNGNLSKVSRFKLKSVNQISDPCGLQSYTTLSKFWLKIYPIEISWILMSRTLFWLCWKQGFHLHICAALGINSMALIWLINIMPNLYFPLFYHYLLQNYSHNIIEITDKYKYLGIVFKNTGLLKYALPWTPRIFLKIMFCTFSNGNLSKVSRFKLKSVNQISDPYEETKQIFK